MEEKQKKSKNSFSKFFSNLGASLKRLGASLKDGFKNDQKRIAKYIISFTAVLHLILSNIQIQAINKLTNEICGIYMFMFVLIGFICLFNAIRLKTPTGKKIIFSIIMLVAVMGVGGMLLSIYVDALLHQNNVMVAPVIKGIILSILVIALYLFGLVETIIAYAFYRKNIKKEAKKADA